VVIIAVEKMIPRAARRDHSSYPGELRMKLLDLSAHDRDVAAEFIVRVKQKLGRIALASEPYAR
jgi:hypothetical protein